MFTIYSLSIHYFFVFHNIIELLQDHSCRPHIKTYKGSYDCNNFMESTRAPDKFVSVAQFSIHVHPPVSGLLIIGVNEVG